MDFNGPISTSIWLLFAVLIVVWAGMMLGLGYVLARSFRRIAGGGWGGLVSRYAVTEANPVDGPCHGGRTIQVGYVVAKRCATIGAGPRGLFLKVPWRSPVLIPWTELHPVSSARLHWRPAVLLSVGSPPVATLTVFEEDMAFIGPFLTRPGAVGAGSADAVGTSRVRSG